MIFPYLAFSCDLGTIGGFGYFVCKVRLDSFFFYDHLLLPVQNVSDEKLKTYCHLSNYKNHKYFSESSFILVLKSS